MELCGISLVGLLFAVFKAVALVVLEQAVLAAKVAPAKAAVTDDALGSGGALLEVAAVLPGSHDVSNNESVCGRSSSRARIESALLCVCPEESEVTTGR